MNAKEIVEQADYLDAQVFGSQKNIDERALSIVTQTHIVEMQKDKTFPSKPVGTGYGSLITKQNYAFLATLPFVRFNAPSDAQREHAEKLEQANEAMWKLSGARKMWLRAVYDVATIGRGWMCIVPDPKRWTGPNFQRNGQSEKEYLQSLKQAKLDSFPIRVPRVDPRHAWPTFDESGEVDQVFAKAKMKGRQAKRAYGIDVEDTADVEIVRYYDDRMIQTVLHGDEPRVIKTFEHDLGMNPMVCLEAPLLPENPDGYRWAGSIFDLRYLIPELDGLFSDMRHNTKRMTHSQMVLNLDLEARRSQMPTATKNEDLIPIEPDKPIILDKGESVGDQFVGGRTSPDIMSLLQFGVGLTKENAIRPVLLGILEQGGDSGVRYNTGAQIAQGSFGPTIENLKLAAEGVTRRLLACVKSLSREFPDSADKVPVIYAANNGLSKLIEIGPKDIIGWGGSGTIQARIELAIPINENAEIVTGRMFADKKDGLGSQETALERWGHVENPRQEMGRRRNEMIMDMMMQDVAQVVRMRGGQLLAQSSSPGQIQQQFQALPPEVQQAVAMAAQMQGLPGPPEARAEAGQTQAGMVQNPSQTESTMLKAARSE